MRHDAIEISLTHRAARRHDAKRVMRTIVGARQHVVELAGASPATNALDEAFAGLSHDEPRPNHLAVVSQLSEQLVALDRQREQLAKLLRDIEVTALAE